METGLVERARNGDVDAFDALIAHRIEAMLRTANAIIGDPDEAREATQDSLLTIWKELPTLRIEDRFDAWAGRVLVNRCRLTLKRRGRRASREVPIDGSWRSDSPSVAGSDEDFERREQLERAFERLAADDRVLLVLHHLEGLPVAQIAARLEIPDGTVKSRLYSARRALERALEAES
ncbi:MAG TPA: sigma-70 family RNA polymerase sigma factor [Candidatus Limnocylindrales bacterium]